MKKPISKLKVVYKKGQQNAERPQEEAIQERDETDLQTVVKDLNEILQLIEENTQNEIDV